MSELYDVAISYSNEDKHIARQITEALNNKGLRVFFGEYGGSELWGRNLYQYLTKIYEESRLCIVIISESYTKSPWTSSEFRNLLAHSQLRESFTIIPITVGELPTGILSNISYVDWRTTDADHIAALVKKRLQSLPPPLKTREPANYHVIMRESGWSVKKGGASRATSVHKTQDEAIAAARRLARKHRPSELVIHRKDGTIKSREIMKSEERNADSDS